MAQIGQLAPATALGRGATGAYRHPGVVFDVWQTQLAIASVMAATHASRERVMQLQQLRLRQLFDVARRAGVYRERLAGLDRPSDLQRFAPVSRAELMDRFDEWVCDPALQLHELRALVADVSRSGEPWLGRYQIWESSGTSGQPGIFVQDARSLAIYDALESVRSRAPGHPARDWFGAMLPFDLLGMTDRYALVVATAGHFASVVNFERLRRINPWLGAVSRSFDLLGATGELVRQLNRFQPSVLATYPTAAVWLAGEALSGHLQIAPHCVMTGGETLSSAARTQIEQAFGSSVRDSYGASEFLSMAWECAHGQLHVNDDWAILEPVDASGRPTPPGERSERVLLTNLANHVQPLIRYDLGDRILLDSAACACGSNRPVIDVRGRDDDPFRVPGQRAGQTIWLLPMSLSTVMEDCGVFDFQLLQSDTDTIVIRLSQDGDAARVAFDRCQRALQRFAQEQGAGLLNVVAEYGCTLPRGRSGKASRVAMPEPAGT